MTYVLKDFIIAVCFTMVYQPSRFIKGVYKLFINIINTLFTNNGLRNCGFTCMLMNTVYLFMNGYEM